VNYNKHTVENLSAILRRVKMSTTKCANPNCNSTNLQTVAFLGDGENMIGAILAIINPFAAPQVVYRVLRNSPQVRVMKETFTSTFYNQWDTSSSGLRIKCKKCNEKLIFCESCKTTFCVDSYPPLAAKLTCKNCRCELFMDNGQTISFKD
jgi:hypothetical protein